MNLFEHEQSKYNAVHEFCNDTGSDGRQISELLSLEYEFHTLWRSLLEESNSFLEIGLGCGSILGLFKERDIEYCGIDISNYAVSQLREQGLNAQHMSCHKMEFEDDSFDVVQHLDGFEHIPVEWEEQALREELRVSSKYVFHANAMGDAYLDRLSIEHGFDEVHVNIKNEEQWNSFYKQYKEKYKYNIVSALTVHGTYFIVLEKK